MLTKLKTCALAGTIGLAGMTGALVLAPAASYAATGDSTALTARVDSITDALSGLVSDGSITQAQADEVATVIAETRPEGGRGGHGGGRIDRAAAATALGITEDELQAQTEAGKTLADIADAEGVEQADLVAALVQAEQARLDAAVASGDLTQAQADERAAGLEERITASLDDVCLPGRGRGDADSSADSGADGATETPSAAPSEAASSDAA